MSKHTLFEKVISAEPFEPGTTVDVLVSSDADGSRWAVLEVNTPSGTIDGAALVLSWNIIKPGFVTAGLPAPAPRGLLAPDADSETGDMAGTASFFFEEEYFAGVDPGELFGRVITVFQAMGVATTQTKHG